jgi:hypothetical protein
VLTRYLALNGSNENSETVTYLFYCAKLWGVITALLTNVGGEFEPEDQEVHTNTFEKVQILLGEESFNAGFAQGQAMELDEAIAYALKHLLAA